MVTNWNNDEVRMLINLRKTDNERFHHIGHVKRPFWKEAMYNYIHSIPGGKNSRNGEMYYEEFKTEFWRKPETEYDRMHRANQAAQAKFSLSSAASFANYDLALIDSNQGDQGKENEEGCFVDNEEVDNEGEEISLSNQEDQGKEDEERCFVDNEEVDNEGEEISLSFLSSSSSSSGSSSLLSSSSSSSS
ncbi:hypothetical protein RhiirA1_478466 [Rhizophagus irregularis]|uniref:Uncharacterized protein n=1 Tax=Rhizophagus irregularis TaxID=588596 RepID=A0A2I1FJY0_9GLOM|nr:hypothetical protein RhiirA1_478466 [Rhizophagus irregularis]PKY34669.1 hypothetical protein RhiirB3_454616 [Rhizophagus irregularis]